MSTTSIDPNLLLSNKVSEQKKPSSVLGKDDFLKILITQLQNQDPLNPMQDREFISQMATFSSLEQMANMNQSLTEFLQTERQHSIIQYSEMIGKEVEYKTEEGEGTGIVKSIRFNGSDVLIELENGKEINSSTIQKISAPDN